MLLSSLDENEEMNVWKLYNVIRTLEETFHALKPDLDMHSAQARRKYHGTPAPGRAGGT